MSKRLVRIAAENLYPLLSTLKEKENEINAVLRNGQTVFGKLSSYTNDEITVLDSRSHSHKLTMASLYEVVYDLKSIRKPVGPLERNL